MTTEERLERVERELVEAKAQATRAKRRTQWLLVALGLALGAWAFAGTFGPNTAGAQGGAAAVNEVRARSFVLIDEKDEVRARLSIFDGGPMLAMSDEKGHLRAILGILKDGPKLNLFDEKAVTRAVLAVVPDGSGLVLHDDKGKPRAMLGVAAAGPELALLDAAGEVRARLNTDKKGPALEGDAPLGDRPQGPGLDTEGYVFTELGTVRISPRFELEQDLAMGQWSYKAYRVLDKNTGQVSQALQLQVELQSGGVSLPPLFVEVQARSSGNRLVGSGTLFAERVGIMEKLPYRGILLVDSFGEIDVITIRRRGL